MASYQICLQGYRGGAGWGDTLIPDASVAERQSWTSAAWNETGIALAAALSEALGRDDVILVPNGSPALSSPPGFDGNQSVEFFSPYNLADLQAVHEAGQLSRFQEVHAYVGDDQMLFDLTLAAFLVSAGENSYFGAGNTWDSCDSWLIMSQLATFDRPLGSPSDPICTGSHNPSSSFYSCTRNFSTGTSVTFTFNSTKGRTKEDQYESCIRWSDGGPPSGVCSS